jgi:hypothetical protein
MRKLNWLNTRDLLFRSSNQFNTNNQGNFRFQVLQQFSIGSQVYSLFLYPQNDVISSLYLQIGQYMKTSVLWKRKLGNSELSGLTSIFFIKKWDNFQ